MRKPSAAAILSVLLALSWIGFLASSPLAQEAAKPEVQKWEYRDASGLESVNKLGDEGWEAFAADLHESNGVRFYFLRRPKR